MVLVQKWSFFQSFFWGNIGQVNVIYDILHRKNAFVAYQNKNFKKSKNWHSPKGLNPWFWSKNGRFSIFSKGLAYGFGPKMALFSNFFFLGNIGQENVFCDILHRKNTFVAYKKKKFKKLKNWHVSKGVNT